MKEEIKILKYPNAFIKVHIPVLTESERENRMKSLKNAAAKFLKDTMKIPE